MLARLLTVLLQAFISSSIEDFQLVYEISTRELVRSTPGQSIPEPLGGGGGSETELILESKLRHFQQK